MASTLKDLKMQQKRLFSIIHLLRDEMGMTDHAAATFVWRWQKQGCMLSGISTMVHAAIEHAIDQYRLQSYATFGLDIAVYPAEFAKPMRVHIPGFESFAVTGGYRTYTFQPTHNDEPAKTLPVRLHGGDVQFRFCDAWQSIHAYLDEVSTHRTEEWHPRLALDRQYHWWKLNGLSFNIMALPGELRNTIFDHTLPTEAHPFPTSKLRKRGPFARAPTNTTALLRTTKQLQKEASHRFYQTTPFVIQHSPLLSKLLQNQPLKQNLRHLALSLSHSGYLDLFRFQPLSGSGSATPHTYSIPALRTTNLATISLRFSAPSRIAEKPYLEGACQRAAINLIMRVAKPSLSGHQSVRLTGYVKNDQKRAIEASLREDRVAYEAWAVLKWAATGEASALCAWDGFLAGMQGEEGGVLGWMVSLGRWRRKSWRRGVCRLSFGVGVR